MLIGVILADRSHPNSFCVCICFTILELVSPWGWLCLADVESLVAEYAFIPVGRLGVLQFAFILYVLVDFLSPREGPSMTCMTFVKEEIVGR